MSRLRQQNADSSSTSDTSPSPTGGLGNAWHAANIDSDAAAEPTGFRALLAGHESDTEAPPHVDGWLPGHNTSSEPEVPDNFEGWLPGHNTSHEPETPDLEGWLPGHNTSEATTALQPAQGDLQVEGSSAEEQAALDADIEAFKQFTGELFFENGHITEAHMALYEQEMAAFLGVDSLYDPEALAAMKDEDFIEHGLDGITTELPEEAQLRLTALTLGLGPEVIHALTGMADVGLRSDPASGDNREKSGISFERYLGGMMPMNLLAGRNAELQEAALADPEFGSVLATGLGAGQGLASAAEVAHGASVPNGNTTLKGFGKVLTLISAGFFVHELASGEQFNSGNDALEAISLGVGIAGSLAAGGAVPSPASPWLLGAAALAGIASIFVSETDMVDRPVDEMFGAIDKQQTEQEANLLTMREHSPRAVDLAIARQVELPHLEQQLGGPDMASQESIVARRTAELTAANGGSLPPDVNLLGAWPPVGYDPAAFDQTIAGVENRIVDIRASPQSTGPLSEQHQLMFDERSTLEAELGIPSDEYLATAHLQRDRNNEVIDLVSLEKVGGRLYAAADNQLPTNRYRLRDQRSDEDYTARPPNHVDDAEWLDEDWHEDHRDAVQDVLEVDQEIADTRALYE